MGLVERRRRGVSPGAATAVRSSWGIGTLAAELELNPKTLRYYDRIGLLRPRARTSAGYRLYDAADRARLAFILKAKRAGLSLVEIRDVLDLHERGTQPCEHVRALIDRKLDTVKQQMRALAEYRRELVALRVEAGRIPTDQACVCGIIEEHAFRPPSGVRPAARPATPGRSTRPSGRR